MKRWAHLALALTVVGVLLQAALYFRRSPLSILPQALRPPMPSITRSPSNTTAAPPRSGEVSEDTLTHHHHPFNYLINPPSPCTSNTELIIVVITAVNNSQDRQAVRETWGSYRDDPHHNVSLVFLLGATASQEQQSTLEAESRKHGDIVQEDFVDSYRNLTLKSVAMLKWVNLHCSNATYVLKCDDDMYVNVTNLLSALRRERQSRSAFVLGHVFKGAKPVLDRKSKWYTPKEAFNEKVYPYYTSGTAYSMTLTAARRLYQASALIPFFWLEDIYVTGLCRRKAGVEEVHDWGFNYQWHRVGACHFRKAITDHKHNAAEKREIFRLVNDPSEKC